MGEIKRLSWKHKHLQSTIGATALGDGLHRLMQHCTDLSSLLLIAVILFVLIADCYCKTSKLSNRLHWYRG